MRNFVVAAWRKSRHRERALHRVEAETGEHAIEKVAASKPPDMQAAVYEAWPVREPENNLRVTLARPARQLQFWF